MTKYIFLITHYITEPIDFLLALMVILCLIVLVSYSYMHIILTTVHIPSASGRKKTLLNTCAFHLTVVMISGGVTVFTYVTPSQKEYLEIIKVPSVLSKVVVQFLSTTGYIYLRNDMVLGVLKDDWVRVPAVLEKRMRTMLRNRLSSNKDH